MLISNLIIPRKFQDSILLMMKVLLSTLNLMRVVALKSNMKLPLRQRAFLLWLLLIQLYFKIFLMRDSKHISLLVNLLLPMITSLRRPLIGSSLSWSWLLSFWFVLFLLLLSDLKRKRKKNHILIKKIRNIINTKKLYERE